MHDGRITAISQCITSAWSPKESELAFCVDDKLFIWNCETEQHLNIEPIRLPKYATSVAWLPNGQELIIGCQDGFSLLVDKRSLETDFVRIQEYS